MIRMLELWITSGGHSIRQMVYQSAQGRELHERVKYNTSLFIFIFVHSLAQLVVNRWTDFDES